MEFKPKNSYNPLVEEMLIQTTLTMDMIYWFLTVQEIAWNIIMRLPKGITTDIQIVDIKLAYLINPITNMKFELGAVFRNESSIFASEIQSDFYYFSFKTDLRNLYYDS